MILDQNISDGGDVYLDQLTEALDEAYLHSGSNVRTMSSAGTHADVPIYGHVMDDEVDRFSAGTHEYVDQPGAPVYLHTAQVIYSRFADGPHEYVPVQTTHTHIGDDIIDRFSAGGHAHWPGLGGGTEYIHHATNTRVRATAGVHNYLPPNYLSTDSAVFIDLAHWQSRTPDEAVLDVSDIVGDIDRVTFRLTSDDIAYGVNTGPFGGGVGVAVELVNANGTTVPLVSLNTDYPSATLFDSVDNHERFQALSDALVAGPVTIRVGSFESLSDRTLPLDLNGTTTLSLEAVA